MAKALVILDFGLGQAETGRLLPPPHVHVVDALNQMLSGTPTVAPPSSALGPSVKAVGGTTGPGTGAPSGPPSSTGPGTGIPGAANVVIIPNASISDPQFAAPTAKGYRDMVDIMSAFTFLGSYALAHKSNELRREISPTNDTRLWTSTIADAYFKAPFHPLLGAALPIRSTGGNTMNRTCNRGDVHALFLNEFAQDFKIDPDSYRTLDKMLTEFTRSLARGNTTGSEDINFAIARPYIPVEKIPGSAFSLVVPQMKIFYIRAAASTFTEIVKNGKSRSTVEKVNLRFQYNCQTGELNERLWDLQRPKVDAAIQSFANQGLNNIGAVVGQTAILGP